MLHSRHVAARRPKSSQNGAVRPSRVLAAAAVVALVAGVVLAYFVPFSRDDSYAVSYVGQSDFAGIPWLLLMNTERIIGVGLAWVATLTLAGLVGHRLARR